jgi:hypothetical protein
MYLCANIMEREKKISLRHYVNANLKESTGESGVDDQLYPLYLEIIYRRQHIQIKSIIDKRFSRGLQNVNETDRKLMILEKDRVYKIIRFEENRSDGNHKLKGIGDRYINYNAAIFYIVEDGLRTELKTIIKKHWPVQSAILNFDISVVPIENLFSATKALWPELGNYLNLDSFELELLIWNKYFEQFPRADVGKFKFPSFIDWMADNHYNKLIELIKKNNIVSEHIIEEIINKIDQTIKRSTNTK